VTIRTAILGASGHVGAELLRLCAGHPALRPTVLFGETQAGAPLEQAHPGLPLAYPGARFEAWSPERLDEVDLVFAALPHGRSQDMADAVLERDLPFVDLGADFRLNSADDYAFWYGDAHRRPELLGRFVYGLPEIGREAVRRARASAAAGCYPTAAIPRAQTPDRRGAGAARDRHRGRGLRRFGRWAGPQGRDRLHGRRKVRCPPTAW
jgi:N-acetyl-gamma-glutamyl-phosphate reductase